MPISTINQSRRQLIKTVGLLPLIGFVGSRDALAETLSCTLAPSMTEGPYWLDKKLFRSDITTERESVLNGLPLKLKIHVYDADSGNCGENPVSNVQIDVWHADAIGEYSGVSGNGQSSTVGESFLRGYQITDSDGLVEFTTIYPGWYRGRSPHIHVRARTYDNSGNTTYDFTTQLFFDESVTDTVYANAPYNSRGTRDTVNSTDMHYLAVSSPLLLSLSNNSNGMQGEIAIGLNSLPSDIAELNSFNVESSITGDSSQLTLTSTLSVNNADIGSNGSIFVAAMANNLLFTFNGQSWEYYTRDTLNQLPAYYTGTLQKQHTLNLLTAANISVFDSVTAYVGYGEDAQYMLNKTQYKMVYSLEQ